MLAFSKMSSKISNLRKDARENTWLKLASKGNGHPASPGPITKKEWKSFVPNWLRMRRVLLHSDAALPYKYAEIPRMMTTKVTHKKPNPICAARKLMYLPHDQELAHKPFSCKTTAERKAVDKVRVKKGTQLIDNVSRQ